MEKENKHCNHHHDRKEVDSHCDCGCQDEDIENIDDLICDLDPNKICDNCMKCLDTFNTDDKGYVSIGIDGVDSTSGLTLDDLYKMYGLDDEEE